MRDGAVKMKEILLCEPVCGSCGYFGEYYKHHGCNRLKLAEVYARDKACKAYVPMYKMKAFVEEKEGENKNGKD